MPMLKRLEIIGFKSFAKKTVLDFSASVTAVVGPNGSGKSNAAEAFRFALGEQSMKSMRGKRTEDLIWNGSHTTARANRASVKVVFDNTPLKETGEKLFPHFSYEEVSIERAVFRDGASEYSINDSRVRLRDVTELLASANIGESGHHIISQGEADRMLSASALERREMLEDALGLKLFEFKKEEARKKLNLTQEHMKEAQSALRELAPHLRFLERQVERLEKAEELSRALNTLAREYLARESAFIANAKKENEDTLSRIHLELEEITRELHQYEITAPASEKEAHALSLIRKIEQEIDLLLKELEPIAKEEGKLEGLLFAHRAQAEGVKEDPYVKISRADFSLLKEEIEKEASQGETASPEELRAILISITRACRVFWSKVISPNEDRLHKEEETVLAYTRELQTLREKKERVSRDLEHARARLSSARVDALALQETKKEERGRILALSETRAREEAALATQEARAREIKALQDELERDRRELLALCGAEAFSPYEITDEEARVAQEERKRNLERLKIRFEEAGGVNEEVRKEHTEAVERNQFLVKELEDLTRARESLDILIGDLEATLASQFIDGLKKVNESFATFFALMFGGGTARLSLETLIQEEEGDEIKKPGVDIQVTLPKKKVQSLIQLSGGERALTSIALIFAMSQVNPPPFLILDETDAALDEANSKRYGDMIENLSKKSQLIVVTHNRETMSRAGILYGVTMGGDGVSKLLSVRFEEAVKVAK